MRVDSFDDDSAVLSVVKRAALSHANSLPLSNIQMRTIEEVRRARLEMLVDQFGSLAALNERLGNTRTDSTLSQCRNSASNSKSKTPKAMGSDLARRLEAACLKERGWMDTDPDVVQSLTVPPVDAQLLADLHELLPDEQTEIRQLIQSKAAYVRQVRAWRPSVTQSAAPNGAVPVNVAHLQPDASRGGLRRTARQKSEGRVQPTNRREKG